MTETQLVILAIALFVTFIVNLFSINNKFFHRAIASMIFVSILTILMMNQMGIS